MATVRNTVTLQDRMTPVLRSMLKAMNSTSAAMAEMDGVSNTAFNSMRSDIQSAENELRRFNGQLDDIPPQVSQVGDGFTVWKGALANIIGSYLQQVPQLLGRIISISDEMTNTTARLNLINDGLQTTKQLQDKIFQAAQRSGSSYTQMSDAVAKLGQRAPDIFKTNEEAIAMAETLSKMFTIAGATQAEQASATLQLTQALGSGVLRGEEFNAVFEAAPNVMQAIADSMGVPIGQLRNMAAEGQITATTVKTALMDASEEVNAQYAQMPMTWARLGTYAQNILLQATQPLLEVLGALAQVIFDNWDIIEPILVAVAGAALFVGIALGYQALATWLATGAFTTFTAALLMNPLTWIALLIAVVVYHLYKFIKSVGGLSNAWELAKLAMLIAWTAIQIAFYSGVNYVANLLNSLALAFLSVKIKIQNFMGDMKVGVLQILQNMINGAISIINGFIKTVNKIPGVSIDTISKVSFAATAQAENTAAQKARGNELANYQAQINAAQADRAANISALKSQMSSQTSALKSTYQAMKQTASATEDTALSTSSTAAALAGPGGTTLAGGTIDNVGAIDSDVSITEDNIKMLKDLASQKFINKYTTLQPNLSVSFGDVHETADTNKLLETIEDMLEEAYATSLSV